MRHRRRHHKKSHGRKHGHLRSNPSHMKWILPVAGIAGAWAVYYLATRKKAAAIPADPKFLEGPNRAEAVAGRMGYPAAVVAGDNPAVSVPAGALLLIVSGATNMTLTGNVSSNNPQVLGGNWAVYPVNMSGMPPFGALITEREGNAVVTGQLMTPDGKTFASFTLPVVVSKTINPTGLTS
jgi:hypothetical protein